MYIIIDNILWMSINIFLAVIAVILGWLMLKVKSKIGKIFFFIFWLAFLPNTIYMITDLIHIPKQWLYLGFPGKIILLIQYLFLMFISIITFILAVYPFEKLLKKIIFKKNAALIYFSIIILNLLIGFGVVLGRVQRINSWEIFINIEQVITESLYTTSSSMSMLLVLFFSILGSILYFTLKNKTIKYLQKYMPLK